MLHYINLQAVEFNVPVAPSSSVMSRDSTMLQMYSPALFGTDMTSYYQFQIKRDRTISQ